MSKLIWVALVWAVVTAEAEVRLLASRASDKALLDWIKQGMTSEEVYAAFGDHPGLLSAGNSMIADGDMKNAERSDRFRRPHGWVVYGTYVRLDFFRRDRRVKFMLVEKTVERTPSNFTKLADQLSKHFSN